MQAKHNSKLHNLVHTYYRNDNITENSKKNEVFVAVVDLFANLSLFDVGSATDWTAFKSEMDSLCSSGNMAQMIGGLKNNLTEKFGQAKQAFKQGTLGKRVITTGGPVVNAKAWILVDQMKCIQNKDLADKLKTLIFTDLKQAHNKRDGPSFEDNLEAIKTISDEIANGVYKQQREYKAYFGPKPKGESPEPHVETDFKIDSRRKFEGLLLFEMAFRIIRITQKEARDTEASTVALRNLFETFGGSIFENLSIDDVWSKVQEKILYHQKNVMRAFEEFQQQTDWECLFQHPAVIFDLFKDVFHGNWYEVSPLYRPDDPYNGDFSTQIKTCATSLHINLLIK
jgi:hypothetical protein